MGTTEKPNRTRTRLGYVFIPAFAISAIALGLAGFEQFRSIYDREIGREVSGSRANDLAGTALLAAGMLGGAVGYGLKVCAGRIAFLEADLAKRVRNDNQ